MKCTILPSSGLLTAVAKKMLDFEVVWLTLTSSHLAYFSTEMYNMVTYDPAMLYSTLIIAILLTKGYAKNIALAVGRKLFHEPTRKIWRTVKAIKPRQIMYYGLRWGIPLYQLKELVALHKRLVKRGSSGLLRSLRKDKKTIGKSFRLNSTVRCKSLQL